MFGHEVICPKCGRKLDGLSIVYGHKWVCSNCAEDKTDPIHCERGCKVKFAYPKRGLDHQRQDAMRILSEGISYEVEKVIVGGYSSEIELKEFPGVEFNSVFFERVQ